MRPKPLYGGLAIAMLAGMVFGYAWLGNSAAWWWVGSLSLLAGILLALSGLHLRRGFIVRDPDAVRQGSRPLLGELLTRKYRLITETELERALAQQEKTRQRLGVILVKMGLVTLAQLAEVLEEQLSHPDTPAPAPQPEAQPSA